MAITTGSDILASDFVSISAGAGDSGKGVKLDATGKLDRTFIQASFGGTGADGALSISSGTTTIDCSNAAIVVKNYTSISITGTGKLAFSNPNTNGTIIILKSQGNVTLTSSTVPNIDVSGFGASGGAGGTGAGVAGSNGNNSFSVVDDTVHYGLGSATRTGGVILSNKYLYTKQFGNISRKSVVIAAGSGGGGGASSGTSAAGGAGGNGGGGLYIECGGALNFTGEIHAKGNDGVNGNTISDMGAGGGGGGAGGMVIIIYNTLTANSGTINTSGGAGGNGGTGSGSPGSGGGYGGGGAGAIGGAGGTGSINGNGGNSGGNSAGGGGGAGYDSNHGSGVGGTAGGSESGLVIINTEFP